MSEDNNYSNFAELLDTLPIQIRARRYSSSSSEVVDGEVPLLSPEESREVLLQSLREDTPQDAKTKAMKMFAKES